VLALTRRRVQQLDARKASKICKIERKQLADAVHMHCGNNPRVM